MKKIFNRKIIIGRLLGVVLFLQFFSPYSLIAKEKHPDFKVKGILLERIAHRFEWPKEEGTSKLPEFFIISVIGKHTFGKFLDSFYSGKRIKNRPVKIKYIDEVDEINGCAMLFIGELSRKKLLKVLNYTRFKPILTFSDIPAYKDKGVHINFSNKKRDAQVDKKIGLEINEMAVWQSGLILDKRILSISNAINPYTPAKEKVLQLERIAQFVEWPKNSMDSQSKTFNITVIGKNPFGSELEEIYKKRRIKDNKVNIRYVSTVKEIADTDLLFISNSKKNDLEKIISYTENKPILTVGDTAGFAQQGVHINFFYEKVKIRLEINLVEARKSGFTVSPELLKGNREVQ